MQSYRHLNYRLLCEEIMTRKIFSPHLARCRSHPNPWGGEDFSIPNRYKRHLYCDDMACIMHDKHLDTVIPQCVD